MPATFSGRVWYLSKWKNAGDVGRKADLFSFGDLGPLRSTIIHDPDPPPRATIIGGIHIWRTCCTILSCQGRARRDHQRCGGPQGCRPHPRFCHRGAARRSLIYLIRELEDESVFRFTVRVDSPMAAAATQAYANRTEDRMKTTPACVTKAPSIANAFDDYGSSRERSKRLNDEQGARIIISASE